ncbi:MAG: bacillithiol biosynthesis cysteine-adding enzyme BshC [Acidobacteriota bacterium]|nr:MAG: bacillithiol biosynthesis cysteine-adding enzyme BshC [Acidobacteriota bacterium]
MVSHSETLTPGLVREAVAYDRLAWMRPLVQAVTHRFDTVARLFAGAPADPEAWRAVIGRLAAAPRDRDAAATVIQAQLARRNAPTAAQGAAADLALPDAIAIVTGQQAGLFGGPLYTLLKAVTTIQIARRAREQYGVPAVPVFWVDGDDHDWEEIRTSHLLDRQGAPQAIAAMDVPGAGRLPVNALRFDASIEATVDALAAALQPTEFTADLVARLKARFRPGQSPAAACAGWLDDLLGPEGLVVFEPWDPAAKRLAGGVFVRELAEPCASARAVQDAAQLMESLGHAPQIVPADDVVCLFRITEDGRLPVRCREGRVTVGDEETSLDALRREVEEHPERFSPNVLLRPLVQDTIFPTACYVAGPAELAYHAQLGRLYDLFGIVRPLVAPRASATLLDGAAVRFLERTGLPFEELQAQDDTVLNRLLADSLPPTVESTFGEIETWLAGIAPKLTEASAAVDPTLAGAAETTVTRMRETVQVLQGKILQAAKKKDETLRRQFTRTRALLFPDGHPQERRLNIAFFLNRYGPDLGSRLIDSLPVDASAHYLLLP